MTNLSALYRFGIIVILLILSQSGVLAWSEHPMMVHPALRNMPQWERLNAVEAKTLQAFLLEVEKELEVFLAEQEAWLRTHLPNYAACPEALAFKATGNADDILERFYNAIRINPNVKIPLYLHLLPNDDAQGRPVAAPHDISTLDDVSSMLQTIYVWIMEGELLKPLDVLCTANDEPDYGFDLGLFEDNNTAYGKNYGFGNQAFGNPNLEYSSQAPFHMGFYHEAKILYKFGPFLKRTYVDYRINLYKALSEFAFANNQSYWGWRFMGWGMHYLGDLSMPYHVKPLPGVSTLRMIWINIKAMLGFPKAKERAIQLVSNRHTVLEEFQVQVLRKAHQEGNLDHPFLQALANPVDHQPFTSDFMYEVASKESAQRAKDFDKALVKFMPSRMVSDPSVEVNDLPELDFIVQVMEQENGRESVDGMTLPIAERFKSYSMHLRSFMISIMETAGI